MWSAPPTRRGPSVLPQALSHAPLGSLPVPQPSAGRQGMGRGQGFGSCVREIGQVIVLTTYGKRKEFFLKKSRLKEGMHLVVACSLSLEAPA